MDTPNDTQGDSRPIAPARMPPKRGGTVEPAHRAEVAKARFQTPEPEPGERFELRDPFAEVTYRTPNWTEMVAKADQLGSHRFTHVDAQGQRSTVQKAEGGWERPAPQAVPRDTAPVPANNRGDAEQAVAQAARAAERPPIETVAGIDAEAERAALVARLEAALVERYLIKRAPVTLGDLTLGHTEYRFRGDTSRVAFTESTFRLATDTNSPSVARSMVDVAQARNWQALRISGNEDFRRLVWLEAAVRGVKALGYEPNPADLDTLRQAREARQINRIEPGPGTALAHPTAADKASGRGGGRKAVLAAIEAVLVAKRVPEKLRDAVLAAATEKLAQRTRDGQTFQVKVYDKAAPSHRSMPVPSRELPHTRERAAPVR
jgi:Large polyvalent protein-associated domain 7